MKKPKLFIASSAENHEVAFAIQENLERGTEPTVWSQGVFEISRTAMASLIDVLDESDFGIFVFAPDDVVLIREENIRAVRDNVVFELGMFVGRLGSDRTFIVIPREEEDFHLPSDLVGITPATYDPDRQDGNLTAALGPACSRIMKQIAKLGSLDAQTVSTEAVIAEEIKTGLIEDGDDCIALIQGWMGSQTSSSNTRGIRFRDVDRELGLKPGSAKSYIATAAKRWGYEVERAGDEVVLFRDPPSF